MDKYTEEIRSFINKPRKQYALLKNRKLWSQLCSSLDVIEDADLAVDAYVKNELGNDDGEKYLRLYGVLQALFIQQDAVDNLCESLRFANNLKEYPELEEIRDIRNDSIGHPTKRGNHKSYHFISRITISKSGFQLVSNYENKTAFRDISVLDLIAKQRHYLSQILNKILSDLRAEEKDHKEKFRMEKLESIFEKVQAYKIFEGINNPHRVELGAIRLGVVKGALRNVKEVLQKRGIEIQTYDSIKYVYDKLEFPIAELETYFNRLGDKKEPNINSETAYIFTHFINSKFAELQEICKEIDEEYST